MKNKLIALCLVATGLAALPIDSASANESSATTATTVSSLPATVRINDTVVVRHGHRRYRVVRKRYYRHGRWVTVTRRVYY